MAVLTRTLNVTCPKCNDADATIMMDLSDLGTCTCSACDESFTCDEAVEILQKRAAQWQKVARWVDDAPTDDVMS